MGLLGLAYQQRARETGDPVYYGKAAGALPRALGLRPHDLVATAALGSLALSRHRFREALALGRRAVSISPSTARGYGVIGDAVELGRYDEAFRTSTGWSHEADVSSYARVSYARELMGDVRGAADAMRLAVSAASDSRRRWRGRRRSSASSSRRTAASRGDYRIALAVRPGYVYALARTCAGRGGAGPGSPRSARTAPHRTIPLPQYVDRSAISTARTETRQQPARVRADRRDRATARGERRQHRSRRRAVRRRSRPSSCSSRCARAGLTVPTGIDGEDVLAWAFARNGRARRRCTTPACASARHARCRCKFFHRGMIERCLGTTRSARVVQQGARAQPPLLRPLGTGRAEARMKRVLLIAIAALAFAPAAAAHPLGNFTINHFSRVQVSGHRIYVRYVVDMAEIPTLQKVPLSTKGLALSVAASVPLRCVRTALAHPLAPQACTRRASSDPRRPRDHQLRTDRLPRRQLPRADRSKEDR